MYSNGRKDFDTIKQDSDSGILNEVVKKNFDEFCDESSIHGLKYIGQRKRIERFSWILICILLLTGCGMQIYEIVGKWRQNPLVFLLDQKASPIHEIPFPAVTICPQRMPNQKRFNYTDFLERFISDKVRNFADDDLKLFDAVTRICYNRVLAYVAQLDQYYHEIPSCDNEELLEIMEEYFLSHHLTLAYCRGIVKTDRLNWECNLQFTRIWIKEGLCYSFNLLPRDQIFHPNVVYPLADKPNVVIPNEEPARSYALEEFHDIGKPQIPLHVDTRRERFHIRTRLYDDFNDLTCRPDFIVFIHNPYEIPWDQQSNGHIIPVEDFEKNVIAITPSVIRTDLSLKDVVSAEERGCYFHNERPLKYFLTYSQSNCELECMANNSHSEYFNCSTFWMPRTRDMPFCPFHVYFLHDIYMKVNLTACNCLPDCNKVEYSIKLTHSHTPLFDDGVYIKKHFANETDAIFEKWWWITLKKLFLAQNKEYRFDKPLTQEYVEKNLSVDFDVWKMKYSEIEIYYETLEFLAMRRHLAYSFADFISQIGGILGCFLGISIFSIIEIVYFCTVQMLKRFEQEKRLKRRGNVQMFTVSSKKNTERF